MSTLPQVSIPPQSPPRPPYPRGGLFFDSSARRLAWLGGIALVLAALAANRRVLGFDFLSLMDDDINVTLNPHMGGLDWERLKWMFTDWSYVRRYMPLGWFAFSATYEASGLNPSAFHGVALAFFGLNTALVYALLLQALRLYWPPARPEGLAPWPVAATLAAAAWWAFHPFRVESTAWISGLLYGQSMAFFLGGLLAYLRSLTALDRGEPRARWLAIAWVAMTASLLTYPLILGAPVLLASLDWLHGRSRPELDRAMRRRLLMEKIYFLVPGLLTLAATLGARVLTVTVWGAAPTVRDFPLASRLAQSAYIAAYYLWRPWWPFHLSVSYDTLFEVHWTEPKFLASAALVVAITAAAFASVRTRPWLLALWAGYFAMAIPFFGLTEQPHYSCDRYAYFLSVFPAVLLAAGMARLPGPLLRSAAAAAAAVLIGFLGWLSWRQTEVWRDSRSLYAHIVENLSPGEMLETNYGRQMLVRYFMGEGVTPMAAVDERLKLHPDSGGLRKAKSIMTESLLYFPKGKPGSVIAIFHANLGLSLAKSGELRSAEDQFELALRARGDDYETAYNLAWVRLRRGEDSGALHDFLRAQAFAHPALAADRQRGFLEAYAKLADSGGESELAAAARRYAATHALGNSPR